MNFASIPYKFASIWAAFASGSFITNPIPLSVASPAASQELGFPPATATAVGAGGTPPNINDFNGLGFYITSWLRWNQAGGPVPYDASFSAEIGGYPNGAIIQSQTAGVLAWRSTVDNNTTDPDGPSPANWVNDFLFITGGSGLQVLPSGFRLQWISGSISFTPGGITSSIGWADAFPNNIFAAGISFGLPAATSGVFILGQMSGTPAFTTSAVNFSVTAVNSSFAAVSADVIVNAWGVGN